MPVFAPYVPAAQSSQSRLRTLLPNWPCLHSVQTSSPAAAAKPLPQSKHAVAAKVLVCPSRQVLQLLLAALA